MWIDGNFYPLQMAFLDDEGGGGGSGEGEGSGSGEGSGEGEGSGSGEGEGNIEFPEGLEDDIKGDPSLKVFVQENKINYANLMKSYVHAQRKMGTEKFAIPGKNATDDEWNGLYNKLGRPELDKYEINTNEHKVEEEFLKEFKATAHKAGLLPKQAQELFNWNQQKAQTMQDAYSTGVKEKYEQELSGLKKEWGSGFDTELKLADRALEEFATPEEMEALKESGFTQNIGLVKLFNKIGKAFSEDTFDKEAHGNFGVTKDAAEKKIGEMFADREGAYLNSQHPNHTKAVEEMLKLNEILNS